MNDNNIIISTRVRLARNIEGFWFPHLLSEGKAEQIINMTYNALKNTGDFDLFYLKEISDIDSYALMESHLISPDLIANKENSAVILSQDNTVSVLINEEDHIRAQAILPFYELDAAYKKIDEIDDILEDALDFSYNPRLGYITSCPTNLGTAMRISVMLFLPALTKTKEINKIINEVSKRGFTVRGIYGEGSDAEGFKYQLSNQSSLGLSERQLIAQLDSVAKKICGYEDTARKFLLKNDGVNLKDVIMRSWGILTNAYKLSGEEYIRYSAHVKLGAALGVLHFQDFNRLLKLDGEVMPANMIMKARRKLSAEELEIFRAEYVRAKLENFK